MLSLTPGSHRYQGPEAKRQVRRDSPGNWVERISTHSIPCCPLSPCRLHVSGAVCKLSSAKGGPFASLLEGRQKLWWVANDPTGFPIRSGEDGKYDSKVQAPLMILTVRGLEGKGYASRHNTTSQAKLRTFFPVTLSPLSLAQPIQPKFHLTLNGVSRPISLQCVALQYIINCMWRLPMHKTDLLDHYANK